MQLKQELINLFEGGNTDKGNGYEQIGTSYKIQKQRFYRMYPVALNEWQQLKEKATAEQVSESTKEGLQSGLKSKIDRILEIQSFLLPDYRYEEIVGADVRAGTVIRAMRPLTPTEIRNFHAELSKMNGDYAPTKVAPTDAEGKDIKPFNDFQVDKIISSLKNK